MTFSLKLKLDIFLTARSGSTPFLLQIGYLAQKLATSAINFTQVFHISDTKFIYCLLTAEVVRAFSSVEIMN